jgi:hypothetical protein
MIDTANLKYSVRWYLDDSEILGSNGFVLVLDSAAHSLGTNAHTLKCRLRDTTWYVYGNYGHDSIDYCPFVRTDPDSVMTDSVVWNLQYGIGIENAKASLANNEPSLNIHTSAGQIRVEAAAYGSYSLAVYDIRGRLVKELGHGLSLRREAYIFRPATAGIYLVRLIAKGKVLSKKAVWVN